jgi:hypothetical protein
LRKQFASDRLLLAANAYTVTGHRFASTVYGLLIKEPRSQGLANDCRIRNLYSLDEEVGCENYLV